MPRTKKHPAASATPAASRSHLIIRGARVHNLRNISLELPRNALIVITGVSGSGKSSLAFDTIYAEGQRRFVESLSSYARQFLERMDKPDVDMIQGISPAIAIEQKAMTRNPRSTVGTTTEIYDYLRLLFGRIGRTFCTTCGKPVTRDSVATVMSRLQEESGGAPEKVYVLFPLHAHPNASVQEEIEGLQKEGFFRLLIGGEIVDLNETRLPAKVDKKQILVLVDRLIFKPGAEQTRFTDSVETAFRSGDGRAVIRFVASGKEIGFNQHFVCSECGTPHEEPSPGMFSFNNPVGACPKCQGFGRSVGIDPDLVIPDRGKSLREGAIAPWAFPKWKENLADLLAIAKDAGVRVDVPVRELTPQEMDVVMNGRRGFDGIVKFFRFIERKSYKVHYRVFLSRYRSYTTCDECGGARLRPAARAVRVGGKSIHEIVRMTIDDARKFVEGIDLTEFETQVARRILEELRKRLGYLVDVGIGYLTLDRLTGSLSGGEAQRINLSTALGSSLVGSLYVLDEPSIGLHPRDTQRLIRTIHSLRDVGNTVIVVEHDPEMMKAADRIVDMGPRAGELGGDIVAIGTLGEIVSNKASLTGRYLSGDLQIPVPRQRRKGSGRSLVITGAAEHNLKSIDVEIPLNRLVCVTGVSGSGKSTLVHDILTPALRRKKGEESAVPGRHTAISGDQYIDAVELVDQSPIGKSPRSNPATYIKAFDLIRDLLARTQAAKIHGTKPGYFSFNVPGGRCEACEGSGVQTIEMQFLADLELRCEVCQGKRFSKEVLAIRYHGKNVDDILQMTVVEAMTFFGEHASGKRVVQQLRVLDQVGMGYVRLGQSATTLSGGEAQRVKLASHLAGQHSGGHTLFIFDEPTTGLHVDDIAKLLDCFNILIAGGHSVVIIEHNLEVIKCADWVIDLGPEAGEDGGRIVGTGTPEAIAKLKGSYTGTFLREYL